MNKGQSKIHVLQVVGDPIGGLRLHIHTLIKGLDLSRFNLSYAYSNTATDTVFEQEIPQFRSILKTEVALSIKKKPDFSDILNIYKLYKVVKRDRVDIIHGHGAKGGLYARIVGTLTNTKTVYTPHGGVAHDMFSATESTIYRMVEGLLKTYTDYYIFESNYTKNAFCRKLGEIKSRWSVIYNGVDLSKFDINQVQKTANLKDQRKEGVFRVGVFGMLRKQKGQHLAIAATKKLVERDRNVSLHLFGDGPDRNLLEQQVISNKLENNVYFYGDVNDVSSFMQAMDVVLIPSLFESFGYVAVEAGLLGRPIVASLVGGLLEILDPEHCEFIEVGNTDSICIAIDKILNSRNLSKTALNMRENLVSKFASDVMVNSVSNIYLKVMNKTRQ